MAFDLEQRTGKPADEILHAGLEAEDFQWLESKTTSPNSNNDSIKIAFVGTVIAEASVSVNSL